VNLKMMNWSSFVRVLKVKDMLIRDIRYAGWKTMTAENVSWRAVSGNGNSVFSI